MGKLNARTVYFLSSLDNYPWATDELTVASEDSGFLHAVNKAQSNPRLLSPTTHAIMTPRRCIFKWD